MKNLIKVGFLVSYDWHLLKYAIPRIYKNADIIHLALDKKRLTWAGNTFDFDLEAFQKMISEIDIDHKIKLYEDDFYVSMLTPMQCEVRERNMLATQMGAGGWHIQLDADEFFLDFEKFIMCLNKFNNNSKPINICIGLLNLYKKTEKGYFYIENNETKLETVQVATNVPVYEHGRKNGHFNHQSPFFIIHDTWARSEEEILQKIENWGHKTDFDVMKYFEFWKSINENNFQTIQDFHPIAPKTWQKLAFRKAENLKQLLDEFPLIKYPLSMFQLFLKNNRNLARIKHLYSKFF